MDDEAAILAQHVARAAAAWIHEPRDVAAYTRLVASVEAWESYDSPRLLDDELLDGLADVDPPTTLGEGLADLEKRLKSIARRSL